MNKPRLSEDYDTPSEFPSLGGFSIDEFEDMNGAQFESLHVSAKSNAQYHIIVKRNDGLYKTLSILNTVFSILAVLLIVVMFIMVFYSLMTITEVAEIVNQVKEHNAVNTGPR